MAAQADEPREARNENQYAAATVAVRSSTTAVASLSRLSPASTVTTRRGTPSLRTIEVATASVGLRMAPSATASGKPISGITQRKKQPSTSELMMTSSTESPLMALMSRRN